MKLCLKKHAYQTSCGESKGSLRFRNIDGYSTEKKKSCSRYASLIGKEIGRDSEMIANKRKRMRTE